jgi:hypothetical protein
MFRSKKPKQYRKYQNAGGAEKVVGYEMFKDGIIVRFTDHSVYRYTNQSAGPEHIAKLKAAAEAGKGLGTLIGADVEERSLCRVR